MNEEMRVSRTTKRHLVGEGPFDEGEGREGSPGHELES